MSRIREAFARAAEQDRAALVIYLCAGDPDLATTVDLLVAAVEAGADVVELGVPFSDPTADGEAIQRASERALAGGTTLARALEAVRAFRERSDAALLLFGYYNPILTYGEEALVRDAAAAGVDGFLVVDLPPEEAAPLRDPAIAAGLDWVPLLAPTSPKERVALAADAATAFLYYVSMTGVTGGDAAPALGAAAERAEQLQAETGLPVAVGFGIRSEWDIRVVAQRAAGAVVGSALVRAVHAAKSKQDKIRAVFGLVGALARASRRS